jgi:DNA-binding winged helix-turn-helix (wHTH) protein
LKLGGRALDILCVLAEARGEPVSNDELMSRIWPGAVIEENNLQVHISALRKALDRADGRQSYLVTAPGHGYQLLVPPVAAVPGEAKSQPDSPAHRSASVAVLPFQNIGGDAAQEYFADGVVEDIITGLSRVKSIAVIARNSASLTSAQGRRQTGRARTRRPLRP